MQKTPKQPDPPRERLQPWHGQSIASRWALPRALAVPCPHAWVRGRRETTQGDRRRVGEQPAAKPPAPAGCPWPRWLPHLGHGHGTGMSPDLNQLLPPKPVILQQLLLDGLRLRLAAGGADSSEDEDVPPPMAPSPSGPRSVPRVQGRGCSGARSERAGGLQDSGWARPAARGWGHPRPAHSGAEHRGVGAVFRASHGPGSVPGLVGIGLLYKGEQCCGCSFAAEPRSWQGRGASKLDNNCSHLLAHLRRGWEQRVPDPARRRRRACYGRDGEIWPPGEAGVRILAAQG